RKSPLFFLRTPCDQWLSAADWTDQPGAANPQPKSGFLEVSRICRDGPPGRLYAALPSSEILRRLEEFFFADFFALFASWRLMLDSTFTAKTRRTQRKR